MLSDAVPEYGLTAPAGDADIGCSVDCKVEQLEARGVVFERYDGMPGERSPSGAVSAGGAKAAWFKDSEGSILALAQAL